METMENHGMDAEFNFESALEDYLSTDFGDPRKEPSSRAKLSAWMTTMCLLT